MKRLLAVFMIMSNIIQAEPLEERACRPPAPEPQPLVGLAPPQKDVCEMSLERLEKTLKTAERTRQTKRAIQLNQ